jgi:hypothetical protein
MCDAGPRRRTAPLHASTVWLSLLRTRRIVVFGVTSVKDLPTSQSPGGTRGAGSVIGEAGVDAVDVDPIPDLEALVFASRDGRCPAATPARPNRRPTNIRNDRMSCLSGATQANRPE